VYRKILVTLDGTPGDEAILRHVRGLARLSGASLVLFHVADGWEARFLGSLEQRKVLVLGAGKMSELSARYLVANGANSLWVVNRTYEKAVELALAALEKNPLPVHPRPPYPNYHQR